VLESPLGINFLKGVVMAEVLSSGPMWRDLYQAAAEFKNVSPWEWMFDDQVFGVQNPASGEIGYCCIMGALGEFLGLGVYLGSDGLEVYNRMQSGQINPEELFFQQRCLTASFEDRNQLSKPDLDRIKSLGLKFRGRQSWPLFRSYLPGYHPWYLTEEEAVYLTLVLQQALQVALRCRENRSLLKGTSAKRYFVRVPEIDGNAVSWKDEWLKPPAVPQVEFSVPQPAPDRLSRIKQTGKPRRGLWEIDIFHAPMAVKEQDRPFYPLMALGLAQESGLVVMSGVASQADYKEKFQEQLIRALELAQLQPEGILVARDDVLRLFEPVTSRLNIKLKMTKKLKVLEEAKASLMGFMNS
jgi:hypothetical protein